MAFNDIINHCVASMKEAKTDEEREARRAILAFWNSIKPGKGYERTDSAPADGRMFRTINENYPVPPPKKAAPPS